VEAVIDNSTEPFFLGALAAWHHTCPSGKPRARVLLIHGISEHSGRHLNTVKALTSRDIEVVRFDLRGAGLSGGRRQWCRRFEDYVEDTETVFNWICRERDDLPLFLLGHSMGGAVAIHFSSIYGRMFRGLLLSGPAYLTGAAISPLVVNVGKMLKNAIPLFRVPGGDDKSSLSRDPEVGKAFLADPLTIQFNTLQQGNEVLRGMDAVPDICRLITIPTFIAHGSHDQVIRVDGSFVILQRLASKDRMLHIIPGGYHEPHNDWDKEAYFERLTSWVHKRV